MKVRFTGRRRYNSDDGIGNLISLMQGHPCIVELSDEKARSVCSDFPKMFEHIPEVKPKRKSGKSKKDKESEEESESKKEEKPKLSKDTAKTILEKLQTEPKEVTIDNMNDFAAKFFPELNIKLHLKKATIRSRLIKAIEEYIK